MAPLRTYLVLTSFDDGSFEETYCATMPQAAKRYSADVVDGMEGKFHTRFRGDQYVRLHIKRSRLLVSEPDPEHEGLFHVKHDINSPEFDVPEYEESSS